MFGLTKREQRWKAEQEAAQLLADLAKSIVGIAADVRVAEAKAAEAESLRLRERESQRRADPDWRQPAAACLRQKAAEQHCVNTAYPSHAALNFEWHDYVTKLHMLANELDAERGDPADLTAWPSTPDTTTPPPQSAAGGLTPASRLSSDPERPAQTDRQQ